MHPFDKAKPTTSEKTKAEYLQRYKNLRERFIKLTGIKDMSPDEVVANLLMTHPDYSMSSWRLLKSAVLYVLESRFPHLEQAIEALKETSSSGLAKTSSRTSGRKAKKVPSAMWKALKEELQQREKEGHKHSKGLLDVLNATLLTGLRPNEWSKSSITKHNDTKRIVLRVKNSKHTNGRANGEFRELFLDELTKEEKASVESAIAYCNRSNDAEIEKVQLALKNEFEKVRDLAMTTSSKRAGTSITLYSFRHQFIADAKETYDDPIIIAALAGHVSTKTAFQHYGKRKNSTGKIRVYPTPNSVEAVQKTSLEVYKDFVRAREVSRGISL